jgi:hypothetical protein
MSRWMSLRSAALASLLVLIPTAARGDVTITLSNRTFTSLEFLAGIDYTQFDLSGSLTGVSINMTLTASDAGSLALPEADDFAFLVHKEPLSEDNLGALQIGGSFINYSTVPTQLTWGAGNGDSQTIGTQITGTITLTSAIAFSGDEATDGKVWVGYGYDDFGSSTTGTWDGTLTLLGVSAVPISGTPVPEGSTWSAAGLLVLGSWWTYRRRNGRNHGK